MRADDANLDDLRVLETTLSLQENRYSQYIGPTTADFEPSLISLSRFDPRNENLLARGALRKVCEMDHFLILPDNATPGIERLCEDADAIEAVVAPHGRRLIDLFLDIVHPSFPVLQRQLFLTQYERSHRALAPPILAAVYILGLNWWEHCEDLSRLPRPNVGELERLVRRALEDSMRRPKLSTIQAGLLLSQRPNGDQWAPTAQLVAVGQELGLHLDCSSWSIPLWEKGLRRRLAWALYMQDKWGALVHGRPSHIFPSNWAVPALSPRDFADIEVDQGDAEGIEDDETGQLLFSYMVQLTQILAEILETFYALNAMDKVMDAGEHGTRLIQSMARPVQLKLKEWYDGLPADLRLGLPVQSDSSPRPSRSKGLSNPSFLHLAYYATEISLHRWIIRYIGSNPASIDEGAKHICRGAAKDRLILAMNFVNRLSTAHLRSFWYFASKASFALIGTFGSLLWATSPGREEADWYRRRLEEYRWTLSVSSKPDHERSLTEFAITMLDVSTGLLKQLPEKPSMVPDGSLTGRKQPHDASTPQRPAAMRRAAIGGVVVGQSLQWSRAGANGASSFHNSDDFPSEMAEGNPPYIPEG